MTRTPDPLTPTRLTLVNRLKDWGDGESWKDFFETYWKLIYGVAIKAGLRDSEAEEVVQETIISVAKNIHEFKADPERGSFKAWLLRNTQWRISDQFRKRPPHGQARSDRAGEGTRTGTIDQIPDPAGLRLESIWDEEWEKNLVDAAIERIKQKVSAKQFQIYYLNVVKKLPARTVAQTLQVNAAQVYLARHRVGALLKKEIQALRTRAR